jgi:aminoglycoside 6-adenylyltransferase
MNILEKIISWTNRNDQVRALILSGSHAGKGKTDQLSDYDLAFYGSGFDFINDDRWLTEIEQYWICIHDHFDFRGYDIPSRLTIFDSTSKVDFSFHPLELLRQLANTEKLPDCYQIGYKILLDKDGTLTKMKEPGMIGFIIKKPDAEEFRKNTDEFWFEVYHVAKYLYRGDLWTSKSRDWDSKERLRQMLQWNESGKRNWNFSAKDNGKEMKDWIDKNIWEKLGACFGRFEPEESWQTLDNTIKIYREVAMETANRLAYEYNQQSDNHISQFIEELKIKPGIKTRV